MTRIARSRLLLVLATAILSACGGDESGPEEGHTPADAMLFVGGVDVTDNLLLPAGGTLRVEVRFLDDEGEVIGGIDEDHHAALTFSPSGLATTASVDGENFQKDVTAQAGIGTGTVTVGYGHEEEADELSFGPFSVTVGAIAVRR